MVQEPPTFDNGVLEIDLFSLSAWFLPPNGSGRFR